MRGTGTPSLAAAREAGAGTGRGAIVARSMGYQHTVGGERHVFADLKTLLARASPLRSGDVLAGVAAQSAAEP